MESPFFADPAISSYASELIYYKAKKLSRAKGFAEHEHEDLIQMLWFELRSKLCRFDPSKGASEDTFAARIVRGAAATLYRDRNRIKRGSGDKPCALDKVSDATFTIPISDDSFDAEAVKQAVDDLPPELRRVCEVLKVADSKSEAAEMLGLSRSQLYRLIEKIAAHFTARGLKQPQ